MAKPKRKPGRIDYTLPFTDTNRLDALLRWIKRRFNTPSDDGLWVWLGKRWRTVKTRRDIDKLLREETRRAK